MSSSHFRKALLGNFGESEAQNLLGSTVGSFADRISKGLQEQEAIVSKESRQRSLRHNLMLKAMNMVRKGLQETCKIKMGERFGFELEVSDWEGWPRVDLRLVDHNAPERDCLCLVVTANDNKSEGNIVFGLISGTELASLKLSNLDEFAKLPTIMKRTLRYFLDMVGNFVLNPVPDEMVEAAADPISEEQFDELTEKLKRENVFIEEQYAKRENSVEDSNESFLEPVPLSIK